MPRPGRQQPSARFTAGFTLIEMLVVVLIIGIVLAVVSISVNPNSNADRLDTQARRLRALLGAADEDAVLYGREIGLDIVRGGYRFLRLGDDGWQPITVPDSPLRERKLSEGLVLVLIAQDDDRPQLAGEKDPDDEDNENALSPEAVLLSSGEIVPFTLELRVDGVDHRYRLTGAANGEIELKRVGNQP